MSSIVKNHGTMVKAARGSINSREQQVAHQRAFGNFVDTVNKSAGLPGDKTFYWDPMGTRTGGAKTGEAINFKAKMAEKWKPAFQRFNELAAQGYPLQEAAKEVSKSVDRTSFSLPIFFTEDVFLTDVEDLPVADMMARAAVQEDTIQADERVDTGEVGQFDEATDWPEDSDGYNNHEYDVVSYGRRDEVTDFVQLAANTLRSTRALTEDNMMESIRKYEERQILLGTEHDPTGFDGLLDFATDADNVDSTVEDIDKTAVRDHNRELRRNGASRDTIVHVTDHLTFQELQESAGLEDLTRYNSPGPDLSFGFQTLDIDGTPIMETHGLPDTEQDRHFISFDSSAFYMGMLQDATLHPLSRDSPTENFAVDAYGTLVGESPTRALAYDALGGASA